MDLATLLFNVPLSTTLCEKLDLITPTEKFLFDHVKQFERAANYAIGAHSTGWMKLEPTLPHLQKQIELYDGRFASKLTQALTQAKRTYKGNLGYGF